MGGDRDIVLSDHLILDVVLAVRLPPGEVEGACAAVDVPVDLHQLPHVPLQVLPLVPVEAPAHLGRHVAQQEGLVHEGLVGHVVTSSSYVASVKPAVLVVSVLRPEVGVDGGVLAELGLGPVHVLRPPAGGRGEVLEDPVGDSVPPVVGEDVVLVGSDVVQTREPKPAGYL